MRTTLSVITLALGTSMLFGADVNAGASTPRNTAERLLAESRAARQTATQMAEHLKKKNADLSEVNEHIASVEESATKIQTLLKELETSTSNLNDRQRAALDRSVKLAEVMNVFLNNKKTMLADGASAEEIATMRAQAIGVAKRAELIEKSVSKMGL